MGGAIGNDLSATGVQNIYALGNVKCLGETQTYKWHTEYLGGVVGTTRISEQNLFYLKDKVQTINETGSVINKFGTEQTESYMKSQEFLDLLNQENPGTWKKDTGINNGYPIFNWQ